MPLPCWLENGADMHAKDQYDRSPFSLAHPHSEIVDLIIKKINRLL
jgi:hypothetical protein